MRLSELEAAFTAYALGRDPQPPDALAEVRPEGRLKVYRRLVLATLRGPLDGGYPYTRRKLGPQAWDEIRFAYFEEHPPQHWELNGIVAAFPDWLERRYLPDHPEAPAWIADLADYERHELSVYLAPDAPWQGSPSLNHTLSLRRHGHDIAGWVKATEGSLKGQPVERDVITAIYRDPHTLMVRFLELNPLTAAVVQLIAAGRSLEELSAELAAATGLAPADCRQRVDGLLEDLRGRGVLR